MNKIIVTTYDKDELISIIKKAVREELAGVKINQANASGNDMLITMNEACEMLQVSIVTLNRYRKLGILTSQKSGRRVFFKK